MNIENLKSIENSGEVIFDFGEQPVSNRYLLNKNDKALYFSRSGIPNYTNFSGDPFQEFPFLRHIGLYAYRSNILLELTRLEPTVLEKIESLEQLRWLYHGYQIHVVKTTIETPNIDVPEDVEKVLACL